MLPPGRRRHSLWAMPMRLAVELLLLILAPSASNSADVALSRRNVYYGREDSSAAFVAGVPPHVQREASASAVSRWSSQGGRTPSRSRQAESTSMDIHARDGRIHSEHLHDCWHFVRHTSRCDMGSATGSSCRPMIGSDGGDDVAPPPPTLEYGGAKAIDSAWAGGAGGGSGSGDPGVRSLVDLIELLHASDNPLWDLIRFEVRIGTCHTVPYRTVSS